MPGKYEQKLKIRLFSEDGSVSFGAHEFCNRISMASIIASVSQELFLWRFSTSPFFNRKFAVLRDYGITFGASGDHIALSFSRPHC